VKKHRDELQLGLDSLNAKLAGAAAIKGQKLEMERSRQELAEQNRCAPEVEQRVESVRRELESEEYGAEEKAEIRELEARIAQLKTASDRYTAARALVKELTERGAESLYARLGEAERSHARLQQEIADSGTRLEKRSAQIEAENARLKGLRAEIAGI